MRERLSLLNKVREGDEFLDGVQEEVLDRGLPHVHDLVRDRHLAGNAVAEAHEEGARRLVHQHALRVLTRDEAVHHSLEPEEDEGLLVADLVHDLAEPDPEPVKVLLHDALHAVELIAVEVVHVVAAEGARRVGGVLAGGLEVVALNSVGEAEPRHARNVVRVAARRGEECLAEKVRLCRLPLVLVRHHDEGLAQVALQVRLAHHAVQLDKLHVDGELKADHLEPRALLEAELRKPSLESVVQLLLLALDRECGLRVGELVVVHHCLNGSDCLAVTLGSSDQLHQDRVL
mmetsp:Transcript_9559/g.39048  ORF Transcript_9559/g.39048 Transcript_9559/m.39048 type:complete len:289 (-) Transcript_9559:969-1835(-)